jgi:hypothetical protein
MMVRPFDSEATLRELGNKSPYPGFDVENLPTDWWWWQQLNKSPQALRYLRDDWQLDKIWKNQIEGLVAAKADWSTLYDRASSIVEMQRMMDAEYPVPFEEILPSTAICKFGSGRYTHICHLFWNRYTSSQGKVEIGDLLDLPSLYPAHICLMKWFERDASASETFAVTRSWSRELFADITNSTQEGNTNRAHVRRIFLSKVVEAIRERENFMPITQAWSADSLASAGGFMFPKTQIEALRQRISISTGVSNGTEQLQAYVFFEKTGHAIELEIDIGQGAMTSLRITCNPTGSPAAGGVELEGYVYLNSCIGPQCSFRVRVQRPVADSHDDALRRIVLAQNSNYRRVAVWHTEDAAGYRDYYYRNDVFHEQHDLWFGLPFFTRSTFEGSVALLGNSQTDRPSVPSQAAH